MAKEILKTTIQGLQLIGLIAFAIGVLALTWTAIATWQKKREKARRYLRLEGPLFLAGIAGLILLEACKREVL